MWSTMRTRILFASALLCAAAVHSIPVEEEEAAANDAKEPGHNLLIRHKRVIVSDENKRWDKGIVPYRFTDELEEIERNEVRRSQLTYERFTCLRFVPFSDNRGDNTNRQYGISEGHLNFIKGIKGGCFSTAGKQIRPQGQRIACCADIDCFHELGHAMGLQHEHTSPFTDKQSMVRINYENIKPSAWQWYTPQDDVLALTGSYDVQSLMHYHGLGLSNSRGPPITYLFPELKNRQLGTYYMLKEISLAHKCGETNCSGSALTCENDGYLTLVDGKCGCRCVRGLDPDTGCRTTINSGTSTQQFPGGSYGLPEPKSGCVQGKEGGRAHYNDGGNTMSERFDINGDIQGNKVDQRFCVTEGSSSTAVWPAGNYCIYRKGGACPANFEHQYVKYDDHPRHGTANSVDGAVPDGVFDTNTRIELCCRKHGFTWEPIFFPNRKPFVLLKNDQKCQQVRGMHVYEETLGVANVKHEGIVKSKEKKIYTDFCYYEPAMIDCGSVIELSKDNPTVTFNSLNEAELECTWFIKAPVGQTIRLTFDEDFRLAGDDCEDKLEVNAFRPGHEGAVYSCRESMDKTFQSYNNTLVIHLSTYGKSDSHFTATAKLQLAEDMCYDVKDRGYSYVGNVNFTRAFEPCLPWAEMTNCSYNSFNSPTHGGSNNTLLEGNFCRNPDQVMGMMPWCYTGKENCERNYCDPCLVGTVYDTDEDCDKDEDCEDHIDRSLDGCAKTCGFDMSSYGAKSKASDISCGPPPEVEGGHVSQGGGQSKYKVGSKVTYKCDKSDVTRDRVCLTSGEWNPMGFVCDVPTLKWHFDKSSDVYYGVSSDDVSFTEAKESCNSLGGELATVKDGSENTFLQHLINRRTWVPIAYSKATNDWALGDESPLEWSNWDSSLDESRKRNKCATMDTDGIWTDTNCHTKSSYVCKVSEVPICADFWDGCQRLHQDNPAMCVDFEDFANRMCPQTCGKCAIDSAVVCDVNVPSNGIASVETESIPLGGVVKFACQDSYVIASGDTVRGCMLSGELSGKPLRCIKECPKGWVYSGPSDQCYVYVDEMLNYHEATKKCASMNATLAKPSTEEENINLMVARNGSNDVWIGLDDTQTGDYLWSDGSLPEWFNWGRNEPGGKSVQNAAYVTAAGKWRSVMCKEVMQLVCQVPYISTPISEHNIVCAGRGSLDIDCGRGREIRVTKANFGRLRRDICPFGYTHNTNCTTTKAFDIISEECNGQSQCYMEAGRHVFGDPCPGIYKYTEVDYDCVPEVRTDKRIEWIEEEKARKEEKEKVVDIVLDQVTGTFCRNENVNIRCENGLIHIVGAEFGRRSKTQCAYGWPPNSPGLRNTSCGDPEYATAIVKKMCQGIDECSLFAPGLLGDPCPGINKYTVVNYTCLEESRHAEWNEWSKYGECSVSCGQGVRTRRRACESSTSLSDGDGCFGVGEEHEPCLMPPCEDVIEKTACRNQRINLKCDRGLLHIVRAEYGRRSKTMCAYGVPKNSVSISNTNCGDAHTATAIMRVKCEGKTACSVFAPGTLGDPCPGINKYSMINYTCVVEESRHAMWSVWSDYSECSVTCGMGVKSRYRECTAPSPSVPKDCIGNEAEQEPCLKTLCQSENEHQGTFCRNENINLSCKKGRLHIVSAEYGRRSKKVCSFGWPPNSKSLANTNCGDVLHATVIMKEKCEGKNRCSVFAPGLLGDPCPGINKYTVVNYTCKE